MSDNEKPVSKTCIKCHIDKPMDEYYKHRQNTTLNWCKVCHRAKCRERARKKPVKKKVAKAPRPVRFSGFDVEVKMGIIKMVADKCKIKNICAKYNINRSELGNWRSRGQLHL